MKRAKIRLVLSSILVAILLSASGLICGARSAKADDKFPSKAFELIIPWAPGGGTDRSARVFAPYLAKELGVPVSVVNKAGGGGWVAWSEMARWKASKDEYKLGFANLPHIFSLLDPRLKRTEKISDFGWVCLHTFDPNMWVVREGDERFQSLKELLAYIEKNPGTVTMQASGVGGDNHMSGVAALRAAGNLKVNWLQANSDSEKVASLLGKTSDVGATNVAYYIPYVLEGKMRPICIFAAQRIKEFPTVPTFNEIVGKEVIGYAARFIVCAPDLAEKKKDILLNAVIKAANNPEYVMKSIKMGDTIDIRTGDKMYEMIKQAEKMAKEVAFWKE